MTNQNLKLIFNHFNKVKYFLNMSFGIKIIIFLFIMVFHLTDYDAF